MSGIIIGILLTIVYFKWVHPILKAHQPNDDGTLNPKTVVAAKTYVVRALQKQAIASCKMARVDPDLAIKINAALDIVLQGEMTNGK